MNIETSYITRKIMTYSYKQLSGYSISPNLLPTYITSVYCILHVPTLLKYFKVTSVSKVVWLTYTLNVFWFSFLIGKLKSLGCNFLTKEKFWYSTIGYLIKIQFTLQVNMISCCTNDKRTRCLFLENTILLDLLHVL